MEIYVAAGVCKYNFDRIWDLLVLVMGLVKETTSGIYNLLLGLWVTFKHLFRKPVTLQYPDERWEMPERSRGTIVLLSDPETGELNCTACMLCAKACPVAAITIERKKDPETKKNYPTLFTLDTTVCCYCGLCEQACNFDAIKLTGKYEFSVSDKSELLYEMDFLQEIGRDVKYVKKKKAAKKAKKAAPKKDTGEKSAEKPAAKTAEEKKEDSNEEDKAKDKTSGEPKEKGPEDKTE
ncbi:MAG: 4Fe-4S dicluster domain-containing protein [candidate division Zixibacteria bacterium]|nr:4Fe-4S dicluster domain-containing protein [candidate division Zixibacteria bacterium]